MSTNNINNKFLKNTDKPEKFYLVKGLPKRCQLEDGTVDFSHDVISVHATLEEAEAEAWRLSDESIHGNIKIWIATGVSEKGVFDDGAELHSCFPIPAERTVTKFIIRRVVGNKGKNLCMCDTLAEAEAKAQAIKEKDKKRMFGGKGIIVVMGYPFSKDGKCVGFGRQYRLYE